MVERERAKALEDENKALRSENEALQKEIERLKAANDKVSKARERRSIEFHREEDERVKVCDCACMHARLVSVRVYACMPVFVC